MIKKRGFRSKFRPEYPADFRFDYKDPVTLFRFVSEMGKITPSRISKLSRGQQSKASLAIKRARALGMLPLGSDAYDHFERPELISPRPFSLD